MVTSSFSRAIDKKFCKTDLKRKMERKVQIGWGFRKRQLNHFPKITVKSVIGDDEMPIKFDEKKLCVIREIASEKN